MRQHAFRIATVVTAFGLIISTMTDAPVGAMQPTVLRSLDGSRPIPYFIEDGRERTGFRPSDRQLALWALEAWERSTAGHLRFEAARESDALVRVYWTEPADGQYGEMRPLAVGARRGAAVFINANTESLGREMAGRARADALLRDSIVYLTCLHELGHALGLDHTSEFQDIMYFFGYGGDVVEYFARYRARLRSRDDIARVSGLSEADLSRLRDLYH